MWGVAVWPLAFTLAALSHHITPRVLFRFSLTPTRTHTQQARAHTPSSSQSYHFNGSHSVCTFAGFVMYSNIDLLVRLPFPPLLTPPPAARPTRR